MAKKPDTPCAGCGKLLWGGRASLPPGERKCRDCRRDEHATATHQRCGRCEQRLPLEAFSPSFQKRSGAWCKQCRAEYVRGQYLAARVPRDQICDDCGEPTDRGITAYGRFCIPCAEGRRRASDSRKVSKRRTVQRVTDITAQFERDLRKCAEHCPLCDARLTDQPNEPNSKHLDHIVPICMGGTHTMGNVRIICRTCNLARPKDGSDVTGEQLDRWAQDVQCVDEMKARLKAKVKQRKARETCRCGRRMVKQSCPDCPVRLRERTQRAELGREAARMRERGMKWREISDALALSGTGTAYQLAWQYGDPEARARWPKGPGWMASQGA